MEPERPFSAGERRITNILLGIIVAALVGGILYQLSSVLLPFVVAVLLSFIFKPIVLWLVQHRVPRALALLAVIAIVAGGAMGLTLLIAPSVDAFQDNLPAYQNRLNGLVEDGVGMVTAIVEGLGGDVSQINPRDLVGVSTLTSVATSSVGTLVTGLSNAFLVFLFLLFMLAAAGELPIKVKHAFKDAGSERIGAMLANIDRQVRRYLIAKTIVSLTTAVITTIILLILGVDFAVVWGLLAFLLNYIPNFGSLIATVFPVLTALLQFDSLTKPILALILLVVAQNVMGNVVEPKLMQSSLNLSPVVILMSLIFWGWLWGVWGMILAVPITATIKIVFENLDTLKPLAVLMSGKVVALEEGG